MKFPVDIHTHRLPPVPGTAIANRYPDTFVPEEGAWYSVGIHPWHIPATVTPVVRNEMNVLASLAGHPQVLAIGEAGLDKLADAPMAAFSTSAAIAVSSWLNRTLMDFLL